MIFSIAKPGALRNCTLRPYLTSTFSMAMNSTNSTSSTAPSNQYNHQQSRRYNDQQQHHLNDPNELNYEYVKARNNFVYNKNGTINKIKVSNRVDAKNRHPANNTHAKSAHSYTMKTHSGDKQKSPHQSHIKNQSRDDSRSGELSSISMAGNGHRTPNDDFDDDFDDSSDYDEIRPAFRSITESNLSYRTLVMGSQRFGSHRMEKRSLHTVPHSGTQSSANANTNKNRHANGELQIDITAGYNDHKTNKDAIENGMSVDAVTINAGSHQTTIMNGVTQMPVSSPIALQLKAQPNTASVNNNVIVEPYETPVSQLELECVAGYDGGLPQYFVLEAYDSRTKKLRLNITSAYSDRPLFRIDLSGEPLCLCLCLCLCVSAVECSFAFATTMFIWYFLARTHPVIVVYVHLYHISCLVL